MRFIAFMTQFCLLWATLSGCKPRMDSALSSLSKDDLRALLEGGKNEYDKNVDKLFITIISEDRLTEQGEGFFEDYRLLIQNHLGTNYKVMILTSGTPNWVYKLRLDSTFPAEIISAKTQIGPNDITSLPGEVAKLYPRETRGDKKLQIILHVLAHGISTSGTGEGGIAVGSENFKFRDLAERLIHPLADISDELIGIIEPCFGGNVSWNLPQNFYLRNNAMMIIGTPPWAVHMAKQSLAGSEGETGDKQYTRSTTTLAVKKALMGFASDITDDTPVTFEDGHTLKIFQGTALESDLKESHIVRVSEFKDYVEKRGTLSNCLHIKEMRVQSVKSICASGNAQYVAMTLGFPTTGNQDADARNLVMELMRRNPTREQFVATVKSQFPVPPVQVVAPMGNNHTLNPAGINGILSVANVAAFETESANTPDGVGDFSGFQQDNARAVSPLLDQCMSDLDIASGDLFDVLTWTFTKQTPLPTPPGSGYTTGQTANPNPNNGSSTYIDGSPTENAYPSTGQPYPNPYPNEVQKPEVCKKY